MNLQSIFITNGIGCTILIILLISSHHIRKRRMLGDRLFSAMILLNISACVTESLSFFIDGKTFPFPYAAIMISDMYLYVVNIVISFIWLIYVDLRLYGDVSRLKKYYVKAALPSVAALIILLLNVRFRLIFYIDEEMVYHRLPTGYLFLGFTLFNLLGAVFVRRRHYIKFGNNQFFPMYMFITPVMVGIIVQMLVYGVSLVWCSVSLGLVGIYMTLQNELSYIDPLTRLYNRNYLTHMMSEISHKHSVSGGIMIDLDFFKDINDTFGHATGDEALVDAAKIIKSAVPGDASSFRFAGDEFIVIFRDINELKLKKTVADIREELEQFNNSGLRGYTLSFSIGYSLFDPEKMGGDDFLNEMDRYMYEEKRRKHSRHAEIA